jgi:hypothetical protein
MSSPRNKPTRPPIQSKVVPSVQPADMSPARVSREFQRRLDEGARLQVLGTAKSRPRRLLSLGYVPKSKLELFDTTYYLTTPRQNEDMRFFVAYVVLGPSANGRSSQTIHPRIFYKDLSLSWRSASHFARSASENWIGKGDIKEYIEDGEECFSSYESTTDLPLEIQSALEGLSRKSRRIAYDDDAMFLVIRRGPDDRIAPFSDFSGPRRRAWSDPRNRMNGGREIARFTRKNDPTSLRIVSGYEPDFTRGVIDVSRSSSKLYGGKLERFRIISRNQKAQYLFMAGPRLVWVAACQATTTEIMSYGVRTVDAHVDDDFLLPGYEYHFEEDGENGPELHSQVPHGFVGAPSAIDNYRVDTSLWLDQVPVIREFRRKVLAKR